jgi:hypothetical protein
VPLWTADHQLGSNGENTVAAILRPTTIRKPQRKKKGSIDPSLFDET